MDVSEKIEYHGKKITKKEKLIIMKKDKGLISSNKRRKRLFLSHKRRKISFAPSHFARK